MPLLCIDETTNLTRLAQTLFKTCFPPHAPLPAHKRINQDCRKKGEAEQAKNSAPKQDIILKQPLLERCDRVPDMVKIHKIKNRPTPTLQLEEVQLAVQKEDTMGTKTKQEKTIKFMTKTRFRN
ncbi:MAG: hypothetical protein JWR19_3785 [Pedosphaera sp.]|nr:hypothetical protein [Pedosphaera sp.]